MALTEHSIHSGCFSNGFYVHILAVIVVLGLYLWTLMGFFRPGEPADLARCRHVCMCMYECMYVCVYSYLSSGCVMPIVLAISCKVWVVLLKEGTLEM